MIHSARPTIWWTLFSFEICFVFLNFEKWGRTEERTDNMSENSDYYQPWLWGGRVDQQQCLLLPTKAIWDAQWNSFEWKLWVREKEKM